MNYLLILLVFCLCGERLLCSEKNKYDFKPTSKLMKSKYICAPSTVERGLELIFVIPADFVDADLHQKYLTLVSNDVLNGLQWFATGGMEIYSAVIMDLISANPHQCYIFKPMTKLNLDTAPTLLNVVPKPQVRKIAIEESYHLHRIKACMAWVTEGYKPKASRHRIFIVLVDRPPHIQRYYVPNYPLYASDIANYFKESDSGIVYLTSAAMFPVYGSFLRESMVPYRAIRRATTNLIDDAMSGVLEVICAKEHQADQNDGNYYLVPYSYINPKRDLGQEDLAKYEIVITIDEGPQLFPSSTRFIKDLKKSVMVDTFVELLAERYPAFSFVMMNTSRHQNRLAAPPAISAQGLREYYGYEEFVRTFPAEEKWCGNSAANNARKYKSTGDFYWFGNAFVSTKGLLKDKERIGIHLIFTYEFPFIKPHSLQTMDIERMSKVLREHGDYVIYLTEDRCDMVDDYTTFDYSIIEGRGKGGTEIMNTIVERIDDRVEAIVASHRKKVDVNKDVLPYPITGNIKSNPLQLFMMFPITQSIEVQKAMDVLFYDSYSALKKMSEEWPSVLHFGYGFYGKRCGINYMDCDVVEPINPLKSIITGKNYKTTPSNETSQEQQQSFFVRELGNCGRMLSKNQMNTVIIAFVDEEPRLVPVLYDTAEHLDSCRLPRSVNYLRTSTSSNIKLTVIKANKISDNVDYTMGSMWHPGYHSMRFDVFSPVIKQIHQAIMLHSDAFLS